MKAKAIPHVDKLVDTGGIPQPGYAAWKAARIERARAQATNRAAMIDADKVWKQLGCDD